MPSESDYTILQQNPSEQDYHDLRKAAGLTPPPMEAVSESLANSWVSFVAYKSSEMTDSSTPKPSQRAVAMGRLIGDGSLFLLMVDCAVDPAHQRKGLGSQIVHKLLEYADNHAPHAYISLVADPLGQRLYPKYGFEDVKPGIGMYRCHRIQADREFKKAREERAARSMLPGEFEG